MGRADGPAAGRPATWAKWSVANGCAARPMLVEGFIEMYPGPVPMVGLRVTGLGHHWPGGAGQLGARLGGSSDSAIDATRQVLGFFAKLG